MYDLFKHLHYICSCLTTLTLTNTVIILMHYNAYYAYKQSYHTYALLCLLCI